MRYFIIGAISEEISHSRNKNRSSSKGLTGMILEKFPSCKQVYSYVKEKHSRDHQGKMSTVILSISEVTEQDYNTFFQIENKEGGNNEN